MLKRAWAATNRTDRKVLAVALLLVPVAIGLQWLLIQINPRHKNRVLWTQSFCGGVTDPRDQTESLWTDRHDVSLPPKFPTHHMTVASVQSPSSIFPPGLPGGGFGQRFGSGPRRGRYRVAYLSAPDRPRDVWGNRWYLVVDYTTRDGKTRPDFASHTVYSTGPNKTFEWGEGDDLPVSLAIGSVGIQVYGWAILAALILLARLAVRVGETSRSAKLWVELARTTVITLPFVVICYWGSDSETLLELLEKTEQPLLVSARTAIFLSALALVWGAILFSRLSEPVPEDAP